MLTKEKRDALRRFASLYASIAQKDTILKYLSIIFIKYASETGVGMTGAEDYVAYSKVMKCFSGAGDFPESEVNLVVERLCEKTGQNLNFILFSFNSTVLSWLLQNVEYENLPGWNLSGLEGDARKAELRDVSDSVNLLSSMYFGSNRLGAALDAIYVIASSILNVSPADTFADLVAGQGISTFLITNGNAGNYYLSDVASVDAIRILAALYEVDEIEITQRALEAPGLPGEMADKMFMDPPVAGVPLSAKTDINGIVVRDTTSASILRMIDALRPNGVGVVTTTGKTLVGTTQPLVEIKQRLLDQHLLKAVITLPPCWVGTSVKTNLLVISKEDNDGVVFIDASASKPYGYFGEDLIDSDKEMVIPKICQALQDRADTRFSRFVPYGEITGVNLTPVAYIDRPQEEDLPSVHDIDDRLSQVYMEMAKIIGAMQA